MNPTEPIVKMREKRIFSWYQYVLVVLFGVIFLGSALGYWLTTPPAAFARAGEGSVVVTPGSSVERIATEVARSGLVRSRLLLYLTLVLLHDHHTIYAGTYRFDQPANVIGVAQKLISRQTEPDLVKVTIPEGLRTREVATIVHQALPAIATSTYMQQASSSIGYLFPDTYLVAPTYTATDLIKLQRDNFIKQVAPLLPAIASSSLSEQQVITMASLLEREANSTTSMRMVAGILENRLAAHMPLQVDATISYGLHTPQSDLTAKDLQIDSPYNTYKHTGLPPTPIDNPGLSAIEAVLNPTPSKYYYYLTDSHGVFHYAATLAAHNRNVARYLK